MIYLPSLFQKIAQFKLLAQGAEPMSYVSPDTDDDSEPEQEIDPATALYDEVMATANTFEQSLSAGTQAMAEILFVAARQYLAATELKGGFAEAIANMKAASEDLERAKNEAIEDDDSDERFIRRSCDLTAKPLIAQLNADLKRQDQTIPKNQRTPDPIVHKYFLSIAEESLGEGAHQKMLQEIEKSSYQGNKNKGSKFREGEGQGAQVGHDIGTPKENLSDPNAHYKLEAEAYQEQLNSVPNDTDARSTDATKALRAKFEKLIKLSMAVYHQANKVLSIKDELTPAPDDPELLAALQQESITLNAIRQEKRLATLALGKFIHGERMRIFTEQEKRSQNPNEKNWLKQKIALEQLLSDGYRNAGPEIKARRYLIDSLGYMADLSKEGLQQSGKKIMVFQPIEQKTLDKMMDAINAAAALKLTKQQYDRKMLEKKRSDIGLPVPEQRGSTRGGGIKGRQHSPILSNLSTELLDPNYFKQRTGDILAHSITTAKTDCGKYLWRDYQMLHGKKIVAQGGVPELKPYVDAVSKAIVKGSMSDKLAAIAALREEAKKYTLKRVTAMQSYELMLRLFAFAKQIQQRLDTIATWQQTDGSWAIDDSKRVFLDETYIYMTRFNTLYVDHYRNKKTNFESLMKLLGESATFISVVLLSGQYTESTGTPIRVDTKRPARQKQQTPMVAFAPDDDTYVPDDETYVPDDIIAPKPRVEIPTMKHRVDAPLPLQVEIGDDETYVPDDDEVAIKRMVMRSARIDMLKKLGAVKGHVYAN